MLCCGRSVFVVAGLWLACIAASEVSAAGQAYHLDMTGVSYDEECLTYCLQGIVNRSGPRLFLDTSSIFWSYRPADAYWLEYLTEEKGFEFERLANLRAAIDHFRDDIEGMIVYDPSEDATRYIALTLAAQENLLPVTEQMLAYETPGLRGGAGWTRDDMQQPELWHSAEGTIERADGGLRLSEGSPGLSYEAMSRPVEMDVRKTPLLRVTIAECTKEAAVKVDEGAQVDTLIAGQGDLTGTHTWDLRQFLSEETGRFAIKLFTVGEGSSIVVREVALLGDDGEPVEARGEADVKCFEGLPIVRDLRGRFDSDLEAYDWALEHLMAGCSKQVCFSAGHSHGDVYLGGDPAITIGLDYPIAQKAFVFNLSPLDKPTTVRGRDVPGYPRQAEMFDRIMGQLEAPAGVFGWSEPEHIYCDRISRSGNFVICAAAPNLSFWAQVPAEGSLRLPDNATPGKELARKYYITFQTNEGDTPKILAGLMNGAWIADERGSVPIAWGIDPYLAELFPGLFEYYVDTATENDTFFAGCSGAGYCYPWRMPNFEEYARHAWHHVSERGLQVIDIWERGLQLDMVERYRDVAPVKCFTHQTNGAATNNWLDDGTPVLSANRNLFYFRLDEDEPMDDMERRLRGVAEAHEPPFFILCYGGVGPGLFKIAKEMQKRLPGDEFEVIGAGDMANLAREAGRLELRADGIGTAPGAEINVTVSLRNPDGESGEAGTVHWTLPAGWSVSPQHWEHGAVAEGETIRHTATLKAGGEPGSARISCKDSRLQLGRSVQVRVYRDSSVISEFSEVGQWRETGAELEIERGLGKVTSPGRFASIRKQVTIDFDREPVLEIDVAKGRGLWALKANDGSRQVDWSIQRDCGLTGKLSYDLQKLLPWEGEKRFDLILFAIGAGEPVFFDRITVHYAR